MVYYLCIIIDEAIFLLLKNISHITAGHSFRGKISEQKDSGIYAVQLKNVSPKGIDWQACLESEITGKAPPKLLELDDILFVARGSNNYAALVDQQAKHLQAVASPHFYIIKTNTNLIVPQFLAWLLNQKPIQQYFQREAEGTLTKSIRRSVLENTPITIPSLEKQQQIIRLVTTISKEQNTLQQLIDNGNQTMAAIATQLINEHSQG